MESQEVTYYSFFSDFVLLRRTYPIVVLVFIGTIALLYVWWSRNRKEEPKNDKAQSKMTDQDFKKLLDTSKDSDYLHGETDRYKWSQNEHEIEIDLTIPSSLYSSSTLTKKDISCVMKIDRISVTIRGEDVLSGDFYALVDPDECNWQIDKDGGKECLSITIKKKVPTVRNQHWKCVLKGDAEVDTSKLGMPVFKVGDGEQMSEAIKKFKNFKKND